MKWVPAVAVFIAFSTLASGCAPHSVRYHTLVSPFSSLDQMNPLPVRVELLPVSVPVQLDRQQIVIRQGVSRVLVLDDDRWLSPFADELYTALLLQLTHQLNIRHVSAGADRLPVRVKVEIRRFDSWPEKEIIIESDWRVTVKTGATKRNMVCNTLINQQITGNDTVFSASQKSVERLAAVIVAGTESLMSAQSPHCVTASSLHQ